MMAIMKEGRNNKERKRHRKQEKKNEKKWKKKNTNVKLLVICNLHNNTPNKVM
jgi:hypothetical protein